MSKTPLVTFISRVRIRSDSNSATTREEVEPQSADRVRGVVDRSTQAQSDVPGGSSAISRASGSTRPPQQALDHYFSNVNSRARNGILLWGLVAHRQTGKARERPRSSRTLRTGTMRGLAERGDRAFLDNAIDGQIDQLGVEGDQPSHLLHGRKRRPV